MRELAVQLAASDELYEENLKRFALYDPLTAVKLGGGDFEEYHYCYTHLGELNIVRRAGNKSLFYHDMEGARHEVKKWYRNCAFKGHHLLFFYGIGLGYAYECIVHWLRENPKNRLVFLEDELGVIERFLATPLAEKILCDKQVILQYIDYKRMKNPIASIHKSIEHLLRGYVKERSFLAACSLYSRQKEAFCISIRDVIFTASSWHIVGMNEIMGVDGNVVRNHYHNMIRQYRSANGHGFKNRFKGIPALICGAGPSIVRDIEKIEEVGDKALIIGSGTGMNVLNYYGITPHFGIGLDPTESQGTRMRTNFAYETPIFYRPRFHAKSFALHHGPKIYIQGYPSNLLSSWFDEEVGITLEELPDQGVSSSNFSMQIALLMGCNPIILLGVDLAYVDASRYPPIIAAHPTDSPKGKAEIATQSEVPIYGVSNSGEQLLSKIEWSEEARTITTFAKRNREIKVINCSKEGLAIDGVEYMPFDRSASLYMQRPRDLQGAIHLAIQNNFPIAPKELCSEKIYALKESSNRSTLSLRSLEEEIKGEWDALFTGKSLSTPPYNGRIALLEEELDGEPAFSHLKEMLTEVVDQLAYDRKKEFRCHSEGKTQREKDILQLEIDLNYLVLFETHLGHHKRLLEEAVREYEEEEALLAEKMSQVADAAEKEALFTFSVKNSGRARGVKCRKSRRANSGNPIGEERSPTDGASQPSEILPGRVNKAEKEPADAEYRIEEGTIAIDDEEMGIHIKSPFSPQRLPSRDDSALRERFLEVEGVVDGEAVKYGDNGQVVHRAFYKEGALHGPSTYYYEDGTVAANCWYVEGEKVGKCCHFSPTGRLLSLQRYRSGRREGLQEYFYDDGAIKSLLSYSKGLLHGPVTLYYQNGRLKRALHFSQGLLEGEEHYYAPDGRTLWEAEYSLGKPVGYARTYHRNGAIAREYFYKKESKEYSYKEWNREGLLIDKKEHLTENLEQVRERRREELQRAVGRFDKELQQLKQLAKHERSQIVF